MLQESMCVFYKNELFFKWWPKDNNLEVIQQFSMVKNYSRFFSSFTKASFIGPWLRPEVYTYIKITKYCVGPKWTFPTLTSLAVRVVVLTPVACCGMFSCHPVQTINSQFLFYFQGCSGCGKCDCSGVKGQKVSRSALSASLPCLLKPHGI